MVSFIYIAMALTVTLAAAGAVAGYLSMTGGIARKIPWIEQGVASLLIVSIGLCVLIMNTTGN